MVGIGTSGGGGLSYKDESGQNQTIDIQHPLPVDGDSVYEKDINVAASSMGTFSGAVEDLFNSYISSNVLFDTTGTNPKSFTIYFHRPVTSNELGLASSSGNFSNVKITLIDIAGTIRGVVDDSANDTKHTSMTYAFVKTKFISILIEFYTPDPVNLSGSLIPKMLSRSISAIDGYVSETNSTEELLLANAVFTGGQVDTLNYGMIIVTIASDVSSAIDGFKVQFRSTATGTWRVSDQYTYSTPEHDEPISIQPVKRFMRVVYTNGSSDQTVMDLQTQLKPLYVKPSSHRAADNIDGQDDAELVKCITMGEADDGIHRNVKITSDGNLTTSDNASGLAIAKGDVTGTSVIHKFGNAPDFDISDGFVTIWDGADSGEAYEQMVYNYSTTADIDYISAEDNTDTQLIEIQGLDTDWNFVVQEQTLVGNTPVELDTYLIRVFRIKNLGATDFGGHVFCYVSGGTVTAGVPQVGADVRAVVHGDNNQTEMAVYTIPNGKTGYMRQFYASTSGAKKDSSHTIKLLAKSFGHVFLLKHKANMASDASGQINYPYVEPKVFNSKTDLEMRSNTDQDGVGIIAGFDIVLVDN